jgi:8-oxo-dGTP pyrophosphatase MutT (NUDIX family)
MLPAQNSADVTALLDAGAARQFSRAWLRERLARGVPQGMVLEGDAGGNLASRLTPAAVLILLVERPAGPAVLFTQRTAHLHDHAGQISFPGGRAEPGDTSVMATALRETWEEIGIEAKKVEILGQLPNYLTRTGFSVTPVVGWIEPPFELAPDTFEVAEIFEVPLVFFLDPANHQQKSIVHEGVTRYFWAMPYQGYYIWGATAGMLMNLYRCLVSQTP